MTLTKAGGPAVGSTTMTPKMLSDYDDIGTAVIVDPYLGFSTHKMNLRFRSPSTAHQKYLKEVVKRFIDHQDYEQAYVELLGCDWLKSVTRRKKKEWQKGLKEHVSFQTLMLKNLQAVCAHMIQNICSAIGTLCGN